MSAIATTALFILTFAEQSTAVTDGDNAEIFAKLCLALQLGDGKPTFEPPQAAEPPATPTDLYRLNISLAPPEWRSKFIKKATKTQPEAEPLPTDLKDKDWQAKWSLWAEAALYTSNEDNSKQLKNKFNLAGATEQQMKAIRQDIQTAADTAYAIHSAIAGGEPAQPKSNGQLTTELNTALYGEGKTAADQLDATKLIGGGDGSYTTVCGGTGSKKPENTLVGTLLCVCGISSTANGKKPCSKAQEADAKWEPSNIPNPTNWGYIRNLCPKLGRQKISAQRLEALIAALQTTVNAQNNALFIGSTGESTCNGNANGACVKIPSAVVNGVQKVDAVPFINKLENIKTELISRQRYNTQMTHARRALQKLETHALQLTSRAHYTELPGAGSSTQGADKGNGKTVTGETDCSAHKKNTTCTAAKNCKWEGKSETDGKCTADESKVKEQLSTAGAGTAATNAEGKKCSKKKNEGECKDSCKWDGKECKDTSFLNSKFALSMAACFISLVAF
ncbi:Trypanosomal VSG domain/Trypanosome variant surface glycoprotein C-terminal domain containing protein, putative [Trypanosoma equiperdum]|uniref:Trypanosomal VSG domain/Trypanosome variant surface glycoprotein C-terminal domain containing protein, putative n=1 Tax=Trypanosoma equiperdum TaxID=5694 RepID=A0A1G4IHX7_TRYEQ|nr:Trypanosomal VSG domain/Trypanosome variant surface glycoprotein C-terminal domain containing protein, putative [Trypanosoma equiperdum]